MSEQVIIDGELNLENNIDGLPNEQIIVNVTGAPKIIDKASGKIVSIVDGAENEKLLSAVVNIEPVQSGSGDPSPANIRPISGWTQANVVAAGKNLANVTFEVYNSTQIISNLFGLKAGTYTLSLSYNGTPTWGLYLREGRQVSTSIKSVYNTNTMTFTLDRDYDNLCISMYYGSEITPSEVSDVIIVQGSVATTYVAPALTPITISLGQTVYGGTLDVVRGKLNAKPYYASYSGQTLVGPWISSHDKYVAGVTPTTGAQVVDMGAAGTDHDVAPQTIKTLLGVNNIWADAGNMEIEYVADTKLYIQRLTAPTEDNMIANENIASGKFFMVGNDLYLSTAAIVAGETIAPGTNCTKLSLAEALNNINA